MTNIVQENEISGISDSEKSAQGFQAILSACGISHLARRAKIRLSGKDRVRWLNGMITNNVRDLAIGQGVYGFLLNPQGRIQGDLYAYHHPDSLILDTDASQLETVLGLFRRYIIMDKVEVADISDSLVVLQVTGPQALARLSAAGFQLPDLQPLQFVDVKWNNLPCTVIRGDLPVQSYEIWCAPADREPICSALISNGVAVVEEGALELLRIACGIPRFGQDIHDRDLPQETEQTRALNFAKGCYIGQEIVERIRSRGNVHRKFTGFLIEHALPAPGTAIVIDDKSVGEITSVASLPRAGRTQNVALGYLRREFATPGNKIPFGEATAEVASLPFQVLLSEESHV
jgi:folate-binding protein YgfZ